ncbi:MAG: hypothetical protein AAGA80_15745 [Cyanobacteria bacterium P01_F01_bin.143]
MGVEFFSLLGFGVARDFIDRDLEEIRSAGRGWFGFSFGEPFQDLELLGGMIVVRRYESQLLYFVGFGVFNVFLFD